MGISVFVLFFSTTLFFSLPGEGSTQSTSAGDKTTHMQAVMYTVLHDLALPRFNTSQPLTERFILLMPGEVLDYYDYCPLDKSTGERKDDDPYRLPPDENAFRLSDTVPTLNPLGGGTTEESFSLIYENILYMIDTSSTESDPFAQGNYSSAIEYLTAEVSDPEDKKAPNTTRFELYYRYKKAYNDIKLKVKRWFDGNKTKLSSSFEEYETWYHENYDTLTAFVSAAYTRWLVSGLKGPVEDKLSLVDIKSVREEVEEARQALRMEEMPSLDGGSKYYPVHFVPSNWYQYLLASKTRLTADQIEAKINDLTMQRDQILSMIDSKVPTSAELKKVEDAANATVSNAKKKVANVSAMYSCYRYLCAVSRTNASESKKKTNSSCSQYTDPKPCDKLNQLQTELNQATQEAVQAKTSGDSAVNQLLAYAASNGSMQLILKQLQDQIDNLKGELKTAPKPVPPDAAAANGTGQLTPQEIEANWMSFSFDSQTSSSSTVTDSTTYKTAVSFSAGGLGWSVSGGASYSHAEQDFAQKMSSAQVSVSAKLLRVTIERNWFRPSLFKVGKLKMQKGVKPVSPGPMVDESNYVTKAEGYQLPEYTTSFLLAKEVSMRFRGVDSSTVSHALQESASATLSGSYGPFSASASFSYGHTSSNLKVSSQADGLQIDIPGAQIIGYYTSVLPQFPNEN